MFENFNEDDFLKELNEAILEQEKEALEIDFESGDNTLIKNQSQANYFCKLVAKLKEEREIKNDYIDKELTRIINLYEQYRTKENLEIDRKIDFFEKALKSFAMEELRDSKKKSIKLPYGTLSIKKQQPKYDYNDELILEWLKKNEANNYITKKTTESVDKKALKKDGKVVDGTLFINNQAVQGIDVVPQDDKFEIK